LEEMGFKFEFYQSEHKVIFSWSEVVSNTFSYLQPDKHIILWTNADVIYDENYFAEIIKNFVPDSGGTSFPTLHYLSLEDLEKRRLYDPYYDRFIPSFYQYDPNIFIPEAMYVDGNVFLNPQNKDMFLSHFSIGDDNPGVTITLMFGMFCKQIFNIIHLSKMRSILSVRKPEAGYKMVDITSENYSLMIKFCKKRRYPKKYYQGSFLRSRKIIIVHQYQLIGTFWQKIMYQIYFLYYTIRPYRSFIVTNRIKKLIRKLSSVFRCQPSA